MEPPHSKRLASLYRGGSTVRLLGGITFNVRCASLPFRGEAYTMPCLPPRRRQDVQQRLFIFYSWVTYFSKYKYPPPKNNNPFLCSRKNGLSQNGKIPFFPIRHNAHFRQNGFFYTVKCPPVLGQSPTEIRHNAHHRYRKTLEQQ